MPTHNIALIFFKSNWLYVALYAYNSGTSQGGQTPHVTDYLLIKNNVCRYVKNSLGMTMRTCGAMEDGEEWSLFLSVNSVKTCWAKNINKKIYDYIQWITYVCWIETWSLIPRIY